MALEPHGAPSVSRLLRRNGRARVLVIDDDPQLGSSLGRLLAHEECEVTVANDGNKGLSAVLAEPLRFHLVLCDMMMPGLNGLQLFARLRLLAPGTAGRVIFISGGGTTDETRGFLETMARRTLVKPFSIATLRNIVAEHLTPSDD
jgi:DNA-binding response OmpR family regulator